MRSILPYTIIQKNIPLVKGELKINSKILHIFPVWAADMPFLILRTAEKLFARGDMLFFAFYDGIFIEEVFKLFPVVIVDEFEAD